MKLKTKVSEEWKIWIQSNLDRGVEKTYIFNMLIENGFSHHSVAKAMNFEPELKQSLPTKWKDWLNENISKNQNKDGLFKILLMHGFSFDAIRECMNYIPSMPIDELPDPLRIPDIESPEVSVTRGKIFIPNAKKIATDKLEIFYIDNFLDNDECRHIINIIRSKLRPSKLSSPEADRFFRTSKTCDLAELEDNIIESIDNRICNLVQIEKSLSEPMQGQYYEVGQEFKAHTDFFESHELEINGEALGQRLYTVMIYLNSTEEGGETTFPLIDKKFSPIAGKAVIWCNLNPDFSPNTFSMHHAKKVTKGYKAIITKWFRTGIPIYSQNH